MCYLYKLLSFTVVLASFVNLSQAKVFWEEEASVVERPL